MCLMSVTDEEGDMDVRDRGLLYYRLLKHDVREAQKVVCGQAGKTVAEENSVTHRVSGIPSLYTEEQFPPLYVYLSSTFLQLSLFPEFNSLSVMYGETSTKFITQESPYVCVTRTTTGASSG